MTRKVCNIGDPGSSITVGTDDFDYINKYLNGIDQSGSDPVIIGTTTTFNNTKLRLYNPAGTHSYIVNTGAIGADFNISLPIISADDILTLNNTTAVLKNKDLSDPSNIIPASSVTGNSTTTFTNKTFSTDVNTLTTAGTISGDLLSSNGTIYGRFPPGAANQVLSTNASANGLVWINQATGGTSTGAPLPNSGTQVGTAVWGSRGGANNVLMGNGRLEGLTVRTSATNAVANNPTAGQYYPLTTGIVANTVAGAWSPTLLTSRQWNPDFQIKCAASSTNLNSLWVGFTSNLVPPTTTTINPLITTDSGVFVGYRSTDTNFQVVNCPGSGNPVLTQYTPTTPTSTAFNTFRVKADNINNRFQVFINGQAAMNVATGAPAAGTMMTPMAIISNSTTASITFGFPWMQITETF